MTTGTVCESEIAEIQRNASLSLDPDPISRVPSEARWGIGYVSFCRVSLCVPSYRDPDNTVAWTEDTFPPIQDSQELEAEFAGTR